MPDIDILCFVEMPVPVLWSTPAEGHLEKKYGRG